MSAKHKIKKSVSKNRKKTSSNTYSKNGIIDFGKAKNFKGLIKVAEKFMDNETLGEFTTYLEENSDQLNNPNFFKEKLRYGAPWMERNAFMSDQGIANPEIIPIEVFDKMKLDGQIAIGLAAIKQPIMGLAFRIQCEDKKQKALIEVAIRPIWRDFLAGCLTSIDYGFSVMEKIYERKNIKIEKLDVSEQETEILFDEEAIVFKKLKNPHPKTIKFKFDKKTQQVIGLIQSAKLGSKKITLKTNKFIIYTNEGQFGNVYGRSRLAFAYTFWYWSLIIYQFMLRYLERRGTPPTIVRHPVGSTADPANPDKDIDNSDLALKSGQALLSNSVMTFPSERDDTGGYVWDIEYLQDEPRQEMFIEVLNHLHTMKLRSLYVPERVLTQDFGTGSFALADAHFNVHQQVQEGLISCIEAKANELVEDIQSLNFAEKDKRECFLKIERLDFAKRTVFRDVMIHLMRMNNNFARAGIIPRNVPDIKELAKLLEIPINTVEDMYTEGTFPIPGTPAHQAVVEAAKEQVAEEDGPNKGDPQIFPEEKGSKKKEEKIGAPNSKPKPQLSDESLKNVLDLIDKQMELTENIRSKNSDDKFEQLQNQIISLIESDNKKHNLNQAQISNIVDEIKQSRFSYEKILNLMSNTKIKIKEIKRDEKGFITEIITENGKNKIKRDEKGFMIGLENSNK